MKVILTANKRGNTYDFEVVSMEPMPYEEFVEMYAALTEWMNENAGKRKGGKR